MPSAWPVTCGRRLSPHRYAWRLLGKMRGAVNARGSGGELHLVKLQHSRIGKGINQRIFYVAKAILPISYIGPEMRIDRRKSRRRDSLNEIIERRAETTRYDRQRLAPSGPRNRLAARRLKQRISNINSCRGKQACER